MDARLSGFFFLLSLVTASWALAAGPTPDRVLIIYNANYTADADGDGVQDSLEVATYYAQKRGVPATNLLGIPLSTDFYYDTVSQFKTNMIQPIQTKLTQLGATNIDVLLLVYGTPLSVTSVATAASQ